jgi:hypothetical protein
LLVDEAPPSRPPRILLGRLAALSASGEPLVEFEGSGPVPLPALATAAYGKAEIGAAVALAFIEDDPHRPLLLGCLHAPATGLQDASGRTVISGEREVTLRCGAASITLTKAGKVIIQGAYISSRSTGAHRIRGGTVHIN